MHAFPIIFEIFPLPPEDVVVVWVSFVVVTWGTSFNVVGLIKGFDNLLET